MPAAQYFVDPSRTYRFRVIEDGQVELAFADMSDHVFEVLRWVPQLLAGVKIRIERRDYPACWNNLAHVDVDQTLSERIRYVPDMRWVGQYTVTYDAHPSACMPEVPTDADVCALVAREVGANCSSDSTPADLPSSWDFFPACGSAPARTCTDCYCWLGNNWGAPDGYGG